MSATTLIELNIDNDDNFIKSLYHLYNDVMSEYGFVDGKTKTININKYPINSIFACCTYSDFVYTHYDVLETALYGLLNQNNLKFDENKKTNIEFIYGNAVDNIIDNDFAIHQDIGSGFSDDSYTIITYLNTDCKGGELIFYEKTYYGFEKTRIIDPNTYSELITKTVIFDGKLFHKPEPFHSGKRCAIVSQIRK